MGLLKFVNSNGLVFLERSVILASVGCAFKVSPLIVLWLCASRMRIDCQAVEMAEVFATGRMALIKLKLTYYAPGMLSGRHFVESHDCAEEYDIWHENHRFD